MADQQPDPRGLGLPGLLPTPVPLAYRRLGAEEQAGRGRLAVRLWLIGFPARTAWGFAMAEGAGWRDHLPDRYEGRLVDGILTAEYIRRRIGESARARDAASTGQNPSGSLWHV